MDKIRKFLQKLSKKERAIIKAIMADILLLKLDSYDMKPLKGYKQLYRLRKGKISIVFAKADSGAKIVDIDYRKDVYK